MIKYVESCALPTKWAVFRLHAFEDRAGVDICLAITLGEWTKGEEILLSVHPECLAGDSLFSRCCSCGIDLEEAMKTIADEGRGALFYLRQTSIAVHKDFSYANGDGIRTGNGCIDLPLPDLAFYKPLFEYFSIASVRLINTVSLYSVPLNAMGVQIR